MKGKRAVAILCAAVFLLSGCGSSNEAKGSKEENTTVATEKNEDVKVDEGLSDVTVTLPASMFEGEDMSTKVEDVKKEGAKDATVNEDGSMTIKMSKDKHEEIMAQMKTSVTECIKQIKTSGDFKSIKDIKYNDDFTNITLEVVQADYEQGLDSIALMGIGSSAAMYHLYNGVEADDIKVTIDIKNVDTGEVFSTNVYPKALEKMGK